MSELMLLCAAVLLSLERICYVIVWRAPDTFRAWSAHAGLVRDGDPVETLSVLFVLFKMIQTGVFLAWCYEHGQGTLLPASTDPLVIGTGAAMVAAGQFLSASVFARLGKGGVFYGCKLGREVPWCRTFPFTWFKHPQYVGTVLSIWGVFVLMRFPAPDWFVLPVLETLYYVAGSWLEQDRPEPVAAGTR